MEKTGRRPNRPLYIALSIVIACALWFYVRSAADQDQKITVSNVPVNFVGEDVLNANNLMRTSEGNQTVSLELQGKWDVLSRIKRDNTSVRVDLQGILSPGEYQMPYTVVWPAGVSGSQVNVLSRSPELVEVSVTPQVTKPVELRGSFKGELAGEDYASMGFTFEPETIQLSGEASEVAKVVYAGVTITAEEPVSESIQGTMTYELIGQDGESIVSDKIAAQPETVDVTYTVVKQKDVPIKANFIPGGGVDGPDSPYLRYSVEPETVRVYGSAEALERYPYISLDPIDLRTITQSGPQTREREIKLEEGVDIVDGAQKATVHLEIVGLDTATMTTSNVKVTNVPEGFTAVYDDKPTVTVQLRGTAEALSMVTPEELEVVLNLSSPENAKQLKTYEFKESDSYRISFSGEVKIPGVVGVGAINSYDLNVRVSKLADGVSP